MEKRRKKRYDISCDVLYSTTANPAKELRARGLNISLKGIKLGLKQLISGKNITLKIFDPHSKLPIITKGRLVWQTQSIKKDLVSAGIEFTKTSWA